ncbi:MAG: response regulator transcription factor [Gammaproteobacteria bacterium]
MRILLVEDDQKAARLLARGFREEGFVVDVVASAEEADELSFLTAYELIILDWMLPGRDGLSLCRTLRERGMQAPILMLTARDALGDRVEGLNTGADDYLTKPFAFEELLARVRALLRRSELTRPTLLTVEDLTLDPVTHRVMRAHRTLDLTRTEYSILALLMRSPGEVISRTRLAEQVWQSDVESLDNLIDVHLSNLRRKVDPPGSDALIHTVRGRGYRVAARDEP